MTKVVIILTKRVFSVAKRKARSGRNPQTGRTINIPAKKVAKFKAAHKLAKAVKGDGPPG